MSNTDQTSNTIAALASFFLPGLGQLIQGRLGPGIGFLAGIACAWVMTFATMFLAFPVPIAITIFAVVDAARYRYPAS